MKRSSVDHGLVQASVAVSEMGVRWLTTSVKEIIQQQPYASDPAKVLKGSSLQQRGLDRLVRLTNQCGEHCQKTLQSRIETLQRSLDEQRSTLAALVRD